MTDFTYSEMKLFSDIVYTAYTDISTPGAWTYLFSLIRKAVPCDTGGFVLRDPETFRVADGVVVDVDEALFAEYSGYYSLDDPLRPNAIARRKMIYRPIDILPKRFWQESEVYNDFLVRWGLPQVLVSGISPCLVFHFLRSSKYTDFAERDIRFLEILQPHLTRALNESWLPAEVKNAKDMPLPSLDLLPKAMFLIDSQDRFAYVSKAAERLLEEHGNSGESIMNAIFSICRDLRETDTLCRSVRRRVDCISVCGVSTYQLVGVMVDHCPHGHCCLIRVTEAVDNLAMALHRLAATSGLSDREIEVCGMIIKGRSNREIAAGLFISEYTVKDHLKSIFRKLGISNRSEIAVRALGL